MAAKAKQLFPVGFFPFPVLFWVFFFAETFRSFVSQLYWNSS